MRIGTVALAGLLMLSGCNGGSLQEAQGKSADWLSRASLDGTRVVIGISPVSESERRVARAPSNLSELMVTSVDGPEELRPMFKNLVMKPGRAREAQVIFRLDESYVTAFQLVPATEPLSPEEARLASPDPQSEQVLLVPIFKYPVKSYGVLASSGNSPAGARYLPSSWQDATHVRVSTRPDDRIEIAPFARAIAPSGLQANPGTSDPSTRRPG